MLFDSSLRKELARSFGVTLVVILTIVLTMMLISALRQAAGGRVAPQDVLLLMGYTGLGHLPTMLSLSLFVAVVATLGRMYRESEMTIWFASGLGLTRFVRPVLSTVWPVLLVILLLVLFVWPWGNRNSAQLKERYERRSDLSRVAPGQFQSSRDGSRVFFIDRDNAADDDGRTGRNVFILTSKDQRESVTTAHKGHIDVSQGERELVLEQGQRNEADGRSGVKTLARFDSYRLQIDPQVMRSAEALPPKATDSIELLRIPSLRNQGELSWRIGLALGALNMTLLGVGMAASNPRRPNSWNLLFALLGFVVYFNLITLTQSWVSSGRTSMAGALLAVHGGALAVAMGLLLLRDHGNRISLRRPQAQGAGA